MQNLQRWIMVSGVLAAVFLAVTVILAAGEINYTLHKIFGIATVLAASAHVGLVLYRSYLIRQFKKTKGATMKVLLTAAAFLLISAPLALAHPPSDITVEIKGSKLDITVRHQVGIPKDHYIKTIEISVNGRRVDEKEFQTQENAQVQRYSTALVPPLKKGDRVEVDAYCNKWGSRKKKITV